MSRRNWLISVLRSRRSPVTSNSNWDCSTPSCSLLRVMAIGMKDSLGRRRHRDYLAHGNSPMGNEYGAAPQTAASPSLDIIRGRLLTSLPQPALTGTGDKRFR